MPLRRKKSCIDGMGNVLHNLCLAVFLLSNVMINYKQTGDFLQFDLSRALHSLQECFDKLVIYHEIRSDLFICNYMIVKE